ERGRVKGGEELGGWNAPLRGGAVGNDYGIERHAAGRQLRGGIGVGQRTTDGPPIANGGGGNERRGCSQPRHPLAHDCVGPRLGLWGGGARPAPPPPPP